MKTKLFSFYKVFLVVLVLVGVKGWGQTTTVTINALNCGGSANLQTSNYGSGAERTWTINSIGFGGKAITANAANTPINPTPAATLIQMQASNGVIYNTSALPGRIVSVTLNYAGTAAVSSFYGGNSARLVSNTAADYAVGGTMVGAASSTGWTTTDFTSTNYTFFAIKKGANPSYISSIVIEYETPPVCTAPTVGLQATPTQNITTTSAGLYGNVSNVGGGTKVTTEGFQYSTSSTLASPTSISQTGTYATGNYNLSATGLTANTQYYYRAYATNDCATPQTGYSHTSAYPSFVTLPNAPIATAATLITTTGFTANWSAPTQGSAAFTYALEYSTDNTFTTGVYSITNIPSTNLSQAVSGLSPDTTYYYRVKTVNSTGNSSWSSTYTTVKTSPLAPVIELFQGATSIAQNGSYTFANQAIGTSSSAITFTIKNTGTAPLNLMGSPKVQISGPNAGEFAIDQNTTVSSINGSSSTTFTIVFNPISVGSKTANIQIPNNANTNFNFILSGNATNHANSTITENGTSYNSGTPATKIEYTAFQATPGVGNSVTGTIAVLRFNVNDLGGDSQPTILNSLKFTVKDTSGVDQSVQIRHAILATSTGSIKAVGTISGGELIFTGLPAADFTTVDGTSITYLLRISYKSDNSIVDNTKFVLKVSAAMAATSGSIFGSPDAGGATSDNSTDNRNRINVTADRLRFIQQPTDTSVSSNMVPSPTVAAVDVNSNIDLDFTGQVNITSTGSLSASPQQSNAANGLATFPTIIHTAAGTNLKLTANYSTWSADSNTFVIGGVAANSYRTTSAGNWTTATWERYTTGWLPSSAPATNTTDIVYIRHAISSGGSISPANVVIENSGKLTNTASSTYGTSVLIKNGGILQADAALTVSGSFVIESGGRLNINYNTATGTVALWNGTENFRSGSTVDIQNWNYGGGTNARLIDNLTSISTNDNGYYFGNLIISGAPSSLFAMINGGLNIKLAENDFTVRSSGSNVTFGTGLFNVTIGGNVDVNSGQLSIAASSNTGNPTANILGNLNLNGGIIDINQNSSANTATFLYVKGNVLVRSGTTLKSVDAGSKLFFNGSKIIPQALDFAGTMGTNFDMEISNGAEVQIVNQDLNLANASNTFNVTDGSVLNFNGYNILGAGKFDHQSTGELKITSGLGVNASGNTGNVQNTGTRNFSQTGIYHYVGNISPQATGTAMTIGSTAKKIIIDKTNATDIVNLTQSTATTNELYIKNGTFVVVEGKSVSGSGALTMDTGGTLQTAVTSVNVPSLTGTYTLNGNSTIELNAAGNQKLWGGAANQYRNLIFSNSGTKTISSSVNSIMGTVSIKNSAILDVGSSSFPQNNASSTNLVMSDASIFRVGGSTGVKPDISGTYNLANTSKIVFTNTNSGLQSIRFLPTGTPYANIDIEGNAGTQSLASSIKLQPGTTFTVKNKGVFNLSNTAGFYGSTATAISNENNPNIVLEASADPLIASSTINYAGNADQTITNSTTNASHPAYSNLTISGSGVKIPAIGTTRVQHLTTIANTGVTLNVPAGPEFQPGPPAISGTPNVFYAAKGIDNSAGGTFFLSNNAQLLQDEDAINKGDIQAERLVKNMHNNLAALMDYVYWSSPVTSTTQTIQQFSPGTPANRIYQYNEANDYFVPTTDQYFVKGKGYAIRAESGLTYGYDKSYFFTGVPNNGDASIQVKRSANTGSAASPIIHGYNLIGNPYPSNISFDQFWDNGSDALGTHFNKDVIYKTAWLWTNNVYQMVMNGSSYNGNNYAVYNATGGNSASYQPTGTSITTKKPNGIIKVGQGFIVQAKINQGTAANLHFRNSYGVGKNLRVTDNEIFYQRNSNEKDRFWIQLTSPTGVINTQLIGYIEGATNDFERDFDGEAFGLNSDLFFSKVADKRLLIQGKGVFDVNDAVSIGANFFNTGNYTISLNDKEGIFANGQQIYLKDNLNNTYTNLQEGNYTFPASKGLSEGRFEIVYKPSSVLVANNSEKDGILVYRDGENIVIKSKSKKIDNLEVYDASGRLVLKKMNQNTLVQIDSNDLTEGVYMLKISREGEIKIKKILK